MDEKWRFCELTPEDAAAIVGWRYGGRYAFYDAAADPDFAAELADPSLWRLRDLEGDCDVLLAVKDARGALAGFFSFRGSPSRSRSRTCRGRSTSTVSVLGRAYGSSVSTAAARTWACAWRRSRRAGRRTRRLRVLPCRAEGGARTGEPDRRARALPHHRRAEPERGHRVHRLGPGRRAAHRLGLPHGRHHGVLGRRG